MITRIVTGVLVALVAFPAQAGEVWIRNCVDRQLDFFSYNDEDTRYLIPGWSSLNIAPGNLGTVYCLSSQCQLKIATAGAGGNIISGTYSGWYCWSRSGQSGPEVLSQWNSQSCQGGCDR
ncbi:MAG: hypothetical protein AB7P02_14765 [Alphaproteobacteria bacterium]